MDEGTVFGPHEPVLVIEGTYVEWAEYETALLGFSARPPESPPRPPGASGRRGSAR